MNATLISDRRMHGIETESAYKSSMGRVGLPAGLAVVQLMLAYECLVSGINKLLNLNFTFQLASMLQQNMNHNPYGWYVSFLRQIVLPHASLFGLMTELGELSIGASLLVSAVLWLVRPDNRLARLTAQVACLALVGTIFLPLNFFFMSGTSMPWINPANALNEGVTIDILMPCLAATLLVANVRAVRAATAHLAANVTEFLWTTRRAA
jgi:thiosulfate dehydrogenase [quinone] large subunit